MLASRRIGGRGFRRDCNRRPTDHRCQRQSRNDQVHSRSHDHLHSLSRREEIGNLRHGYLLECRVTRVPQWPPTCAPFSATERFISSTASTTTNATMASSQKTSKYAREEACCCRRFASACHANCCAATGSPVCWRNIACA